MVHKSLLFTLLVIFPLIACAQRECKVSGEYTYYAPLKVSPGLCRSHYHQLQTLEAKFGLGYAW